MRTVSISPADVSTSGRGRRSWGRLQALADRVTAHRELVPRELRLLRPFTVGFWLRNHHLTSSLVHAVFRRRSRDKSRDEPAKHAGELLVRVLVALLRAAEHEDTEASCSIGERYDEELPRLGGDPRTESALTDAHEPPLVKRFGERVVLRRKRPLEMELLLRMCRAELQNIVRPEQPDLRDVVFERAGDEGGHVLEGLRHPLTEEG